MPLLRAAALTDIGRVRRQNEDRFLFDEAGGLFGVADGVGGLPGGAEAAQGARRDLCHSGISIGQEFGERRHGLRVLADTQTVNDADEQAAFELAEGLAQGGIHGGIRDWFEREPGHVRELLIGEQGRQDRHGLRGADMRQLLAGLGLFPGWRVRLEDGDEFVFLSKGGAGQEENSEEERFHGKVF